MLRSNTFLILTVVLLLALLAAPGMAAADTAPVTIVISRTGSGFIYAGQAVWHGPDCPAPTRMTPEGGDSYVCPPAVKLPYPPPQRRPIPIRLP
jgi:hypothetical protein